MSGRPSKLTLLQPKWLLLHVITLAVCGAMIWLGHWQWRAAIRRGDDLRNYAYALQWWAFVGFTMLMWFRIVHDHLRPDRHAKAQPQQVSAQPAGALDGGPAADGVTHQAGSQQSATQQADTQQSGTQQSATQQPGTQQPGTQQAGATRYRGYTPPPSPNPELETDPERRRLNAYLARLSAADREAAE
ncbi:MAG: hypothetical protein ABIQ09_11930 [Jatrophihabitantaceae bacterium]